MCQALRQGFQQRLSVFLAQAEPAQKGGGEGRISPRGGGHEIRQLIKTGQAENLTGQQVRSQPGGFRIGVILGQADLFLILSGLIQVIVDFFTGPDASELEFSILDGLQGKHQGMVPVRMNSEASFQPAPDFELFPHFLRKSIADRGQAFSRKKSHHDGAQESTEYSLHVVSILPNQSFPSEISSSRIRRTASGSSVLLISARHLLAPLSP